MGILFEGELFDSSKYEQLANIPSKEVLLGKLVGGLSSTMSKFVMTLGGAMSKLAGTLESLKTQKS